MPAYAAPYRQYLAFARLHDDAEMENDFSMIASGTWETKFLDFKTNIMANVRTFEKSIYDYIKSDDNDEIFPKSEEWTYRDSTEEDYDDEYWSFNILDTIDSDLINNYWHGEHEYYWEWVVERND